jgi:hypothetical protein
VSIQVTGRLEEFRDLVKEVVRSACRAALKEAGFIPDDYLVEVESDMDGKWEYVFYWDQRIA